MASNKIQMLVNYVPNQECRIALVEDGKLDELYQERASAESHVGNIYKGRITNVEPAIQAAFVDFGLERNGFLHITDLHPRYFPGKMREQVEVVGLKTPHRERPLIQKALKRGDDVLVQVIKEGLGTKGPTLTSYLSIPGRFLVMMPHMQRLGVSRKIEEDLVRRKLRKMLGELNPPKGFGFIVRTAGVDRTKAELKRDLSYLLRLWKAIEARMKTVVVGELYTESDLIIRTIRDVFSSDISRIVVDDAHAAKRARDFLSVASPRSESNVMLYSEQIPLFDRFKIEQQIETINSRTVPLPSGGSLVIDSTEAMVTIDVNSGKSRKSRDAETNAYKTDLEAVDEICRQLRLRDLGGVIAIDLIDMHQARHRRDVEQQFRNNIRKDRARTRTGSISQFGILEMTRQRMRPSLKKSIYIDCTACQGSGQVKSPESVVIEVMRRLALVLHCKKVARTELTVSPSVAFQLLNNRRSQLAEVEQKHNKSITVRVNDNATLDFMNIDAFDQRGGTVDTQGMAPFEEPVFEIVEALDEIDDEQYAGAVARSAAREQPEEPEDADDGGETAKAAGEGEPKTKRRRRRRRGGRGRSKKTTPESSPGTASAVTVTEKTTVKNDSTTTSKKKTPRQRSLSSHSPEPKAGHGYDNPSLTEQE